VAFASTRVIATAAHIGQAIGMAAYIAKEKGAKVEELAEVAHHESRVTNHESHSSRITYHASQYLNPRDILTEGFVSELQQELLKAGQHIPKLEVQDDTDLVQHATLHASSSFELGAFDADFALPIETAVAQMLPLEAGSVPDITVE